MNKKYHREVRPMFKSLEQYLGLELDRVRHTELEQFAEEHKQFVRMNDKKDEALFGIECHTLKIRADYDARIDATVYQGLIEGYAPYEVLFDTGYRSSVDEVLTYLKLGVENLGLGNPDLDEEDEDEDEVDA